MTCLPAFFTRIAVAFQLVKPNYYAIATRAGLKNVVARTVLRVRRSWNVSTCKGVGEVCQLRRRPVTRLPLVLPRHSNAADAFACLHISRVRRKSLTASARTSRPARI